MFDLVTLAQARSHLRLDEFNETDQTLADLVAVASGVVLTHVKAPADATSAQDVWHTEAVPGNVQAAALLVMGDLYFHRQGETANPVSDAVVALLCPYRVPSLA